MVIRALHNCSVITTDNRLLIPDNDINWRGYTGTVYQHVRACMHACGGALRQAGLRCRGNPAPGLSGAERSFACSVCDHLRVSAEHTLEFLPAGFLSIRLDQSGTPAPNGNNKHMLTSLLINAPIHREPRLTWGTFPRPWMPPGTGLNWLRSVRNIVGAKRVWGKRRAGFEEKGRMAPMRPWITAPPLSNSRSAPKTGNFSSNRVNSTSLVSICMEGLCSETLSLGSGNVNLIWARLLNTLKH